MDRYIDIMKRTTELAETCLESLEHIKARLNEGEFESTMMMFHDFAHAFYQVQESIQPVLKELSDNEMKLLSDSLHKTIELIVSNYEEGNRGKVAEVLQFVMIPRYKRWQAEINNCFRPYLLS